MKEDLLKNFEEWKKSGNAKSEKEQELFRSLTSLSNESHSVDANFRNEILKEVKNLQTNETLWRLIMRLLGETLSGGVSALTKSNLRLAGSVIGACAALFLVINLGTDYASLSRQRISEQTAMPENIPQKVGEPAGEYNDSRISAPVNRIFDYLSSGPEQDELEIAPEAKQKSEGSAPASSPPLSAMKRSNLADSSAVGRVQEYEMRKDRLAAPSQAYGFSEDAMISPPFIGGGAERYGSYAPQPRMQVGTEAFSTFAIDIDTASYTNFRRFVRMRSVPPIDAIRVEEFVNYFGYNYPKPANETFGVTTEISPAPFTPHRHILRVGLQTGDAIDKGDKPWNLVFLVDVSGSMDDPQKLPLVKAALTVLAEKMRATDKIAIVTYAGSSGVVLPSTEGKNREAILSAIGGLSSGGSTNGEGGIRLAYQIASQNLIQGSVNRVVLATDGDFNVGVTSHDELLGIIRDKKSSGITLTTLGFGSGNINDHLMEQLADKGDGNYFYVDSMAEAKKILSDGLTKNLDLLAKDVKVQVEFNPAVVSEYRLIGFDNRKLEKQDFRDDTKDGGEVGPGHQVTALYEILLKENQEKLNVESRYQQKPESTPSAPALNASHSNEIGAVRIRYKGAQGGDAKEMLVPISRDIKSSFDSASVDHRFATGVATLAEVLRKSGFEPQITLKEIRNVLDGAKGEDPKGERRELVELVDELMVVR